ncbi:MAG: IS66 family transposase [Lachnospiraceae bacterium]|nr:IS66 family transposase [Lachnospiraceae bacterium]
MARAKRSAPNYSSENLPVIIPDRESLPLWCTLIYSAFLHSLVKIFLLRKDLDDSKVKLRDYESLLTQCADFLNTTSNNSNWPSSVTASPIMDRGRHLLISIRTALGIDDKKQNGERPASEKSQNETNCSDKPDPPAKERKPRKSHHPGASRKILPPDIIKDIDGTECPYCHGHSVRRGKKYTLYQVLDIVIQKVVRHFHIWDCVCNECGKHFKPEIPPEAKNGNGPCITSLIGLFTALGVSRRKIQAFFKQVVDLEISQGGIQKCLDRVSSAITPCYKAIARESRRATVNYIDETSSRLFGPAGKKKHWLWAMVSSTFVFFMIQASRSTKAFETLTGDWTGILVSDGYALYLHWAGVARQTCLAHLIRKAKKFSESTKPEIASGGRWILAELRRLVKMAHTPPTNGQFLAWKGRFIRCVQKHLDNDGELGTFAKHLLREATYLTTFLGYDGVDPTNNRCERALRPYVCRRKTSFGTTSLHGEEDISKLLTLHETCRINGRSTFAELLNAVTHQANGKTPSLYWIRKAGIKARSFVS